MAVGLPATASAAPASAQPWERAWSWSATSPGLPKGCAPYSGRATSGLRWSPSLVDNTGSGRLELRTGLDAGAPAVGSGVGCTGRAQRYGRVEVRALVPRGAGLVGRIALWPKATSRGSDWSGLTVPSGDVGPAYVTNGTGDEAYGAAVPAHLAGTFHTYALTWSPDGFTVAVDGRELYRDEESFDGARWLGISLATTGPGRRDSPLVVDEIVAYRWAGALPPRATPSPASPSRAAATGSPDGTSGDGRRDQSVRDALAGPGLAAVGTPPLTAAGTAGGPGAGDAAAGAAETALAADGTRSGLNSVLERTGLGAPWLVGGGCVAVGVLVGVLRAARASRRRPLVPR
jgi:hypothetical protein